MRIWINLLLKGSSCLETSAHLEFYEDRRGFQIAVVEREKFP